MTASHHSFIRATMLLFRQCVLCVLDQCEQDIVRSISIVDQTCQTTDLGAVAATNKIQRTQTTHVHGRHTARGGHRIRRRRRSRSGSRKHWLQLRLLVLLILRVLQLQLLLLLLQLERLRLVLLLEQLLMMILLLLLLVLLLLRGMCKSGIEPMPKAIAVPSGQGLVHPLHNQEPYTPGSRHTHVARTIHTDCMRRQRAW